jgi:hypothetical protein
MEQLRRTSNRDRNRTQAVTRALDSDTRAGTGSHKTCSAHRTHILATSRRDQLCAASATDAGLKPRAETLTRRLPRNPRIAGMSTARYGMPMAVAEQVSAVADGAAGSRL